MPDEYALCSVHNLNPGNLVDLEGDKYADPLRDHDEFAWEHAQVLDVIRETDTCVCVYFSTATVGFPPDHLVRVLRMDGEQI